MNTRTVCATVTVTLLLFIPAHAQWLNYPTAGVPRLPDGKPNLKAPVPRMADGKPNLSGVWDARCYSEECLQSGAPLAGGASPLFMDGRPLPEVSEHTWLGYSIGKWEGDTFVVETTGLKDGGWLDTLKARPHSDALRVTERLRRTDFGHMELTITINDPKAYIKPWTVKTALNLVADGELLEGSCDNHDKSMEHRRMSPPPPEPPSPGPH